MVGSEGRGERKRASSVTAGAAQPRSHTLPPSGSVKLKNRRGPNQPPTQTPRVLQIRWRSYGRGELERMVMVSSSGGISVTTSLLRASGKTGSK